MTVKTKSFISSLIYNNLRPEEIIYLDDVFTKFNGYPSLHEIWELMDDQWIAFGCDPEHLDERWMAFYQHPVWLLNGLFIEQHAQSLENRQVFTDWVARQRPMRVADFGGGFGSLARLIGEALPLAEVEVVDPYPHPAAIDIAAITPNVRFVSELNGEYDLLIATDVFEHVPDPIGLVAESAKHLCVGGQYLIANCFQPVVLCHLPQLFYLNVAWDPAMEEMGLVPGERVQYGRVYRRQQDLLNVTAARHFTNCAYKLYPWLQYLPRGQSRVGQLLMRWLCW